ncbi:MAG: carboxypeptidase-like regulatory domain-containing protein [Flavobacteriales bacterium]|nr:carboxypeptidase-like regulatory domain-containing protein [Flavobacteriales bacterium]
MHKSPKLIRYFLPFLVTILCFSTLDMYAQTDKDDLLQFSGVLLTRDSLEAVPFANIIIKDSNRGTISDYFGYYSFVAQPGDTIIFSYIGFKDAIFVIPDSLNRKQYSLIQMMDMDTIVLQEAIIYPWPTKEQFRQAFLDLRLPEDDKQRAERNLARAEMKERMENMQMDGSENFTYAMQQHGAQLYYAGQLPPNNLLNPIAWMKFIKAWKNGDFKRKKKR